MKWITLLALVIGNISFAASDYYILCEGNFMTPNASLWHLSSDLNQINGPVYWQYPQNPLGDTGQSVTISGNRMALVVNNSNTVELMTLSQGNADFERSLELTGAGPRNVFFLGEQLFITMWSLPGILMVDLNTAAVTDTLLLDGKPEDVYVCGDYLFVTLIERADSYEKDNRIQIFKKSENGWDFLTQQDVIAGPVEMSVHSDNEKLVIYAVSIYYNDAWKTIGGLNRLIFNPSNESLTYQSNEIGVVNSIVSDLSPVDDNPYKMRMSYNGKFYDADEYLQLTEVSGFPVISHSTLYTFFEDDENLIMGTTDDYTAPDSILIWNKSSQRLTGRFAVGALPGSIAAYSSPDKINERVIQASAFQVMSNFPNPFNNSTIIEWNVVQDGNYSISLYNLAGQRLQYRELGWIGSGIHHSHFTMNENQPSGIYLIKINSGHMSISHPLVYIR